MTWATFQVAERDSRCHSRGPRYQVNVDGQHIREAHVDHLQPGVR